MEHAPSTAEPVALVVDGNSLAHRAFHAYGRAGMVDSHGRPQEVCYGFTRLLGAVCDKVREHHGRLDSVLVAFDSKVNRRRQTDPGYKASRPPTDASLLGQLTRLTALLGAMGVRVEVHEGWEADDVCASAVREATSAGWRAVVCTSDRDALALVGDACQVLQLRNGMDTARFLAPADVAEHYGVDPSRYPLMAALRGDPSDDLPGVPGLGPKKAAALASRFATLDDMLVDPAGVRDVVGPSAASKLAEFRRAVERNLALMGLNDQLPTAMCTAGLPTLEQVVVALGDAQLGALQTKAAPQLAAEHQGPLRAGRRGDQDSDQPSLFDSLGDDPVLPVRRPTA